MKIEHRNNEENVFLFDIRRGIRNVPHNIAQLIRNIKYVHQRATRGFADCDVWGLSETASRIFSGALEQLAATTDGCPVNMDYDDWVNKLKEAAYKLYYSTDEAAFDEERLPEELKNKYESVIDELRKKWTYEEREDGSYVLKTNYSEEEEHISQLWAEEEKRIYEVRKAMREEAFQFLSDHWTDLWD